MNMSTRAVARRLHASRRPPPTSLHPIHPPHSLAHALTRAIACRGTCTTAIVANIHHSGASQNPPSHLDLPPATSSVPPPSPLPPTPSQAPSSPRRNAIRDTRPFSDFLTDKFNRQHSYLRISLTEKCNLRCVYCMPEEGVPLSAPSSLLTTPEIVLLASTFVSQGVNKIRLTGGEPTVRPDILPLMQQLGALQPHGLRELCITTNGVALHRKLEPMVKAGLTGVNLSLDTLDPWQYQIMTRRRGFDAVQRSITRLHDLNRAGAGVRFKINCVVMRGINDRELLDFVDMTRDHDVEVRFIEYMPFDGNKWSQGKMFSYAEMLDRIRERYPSLQKVQDHKNDTSKTWHIPGFAGRLGFVTSMTHNFCGTCNRLRITSDGNLKVCLFGNEEVSLRDILREINDGRPIDEEALAKLRKVAMDQQLPARPAGSDENVETPLMLTPNTEQLLRVIGVAVKRKEAGHAGMDNLEHMKNRPMILIDQIEPPSTKHAKRSVDVYSPRRRATPHCTTRMPSPASIPLHLLSTNSHPTTSTVHHIPARLFSSTNRRQRSTKDNHNSNNKVKEDDAASNNAAVHPPPPPKLTHLTPTGAAHMVPIHDKQTTTRTARAVCSVHFSNPAVARLIRENSLKKGDVLGVARIAGIMAAKRTPDLIPLCHPIMLSHVSVDLSLLSSSTSTSTSTELTTINASDKEVEDGSSSSSGRVDVSATVTCDGRTGVEMEALTAAMAAALTVYDMCKAVDKGMRVEGLRVVLKEGGKSGRWVEGEGEEGDGVPSPPTTELSGGKS